MCQWQVKGRKMKEIYMIDGGSTIVSDEDYEWLSQYDWYTSERDRYVYRYEKLGKFGLKWKYKAVLIHRAILNADPDEICDHKNGDRRDNRRENLRIVTRQINSQNSMNRTNQHGWRGIYKNKRTNGPMCWYARLTVDGKLYRSPGLSSSREAALYFNELAMKHLGPTYRFFNQVFAPNTFKTERDI